MKLSSLNLRLTMREPSGRNLTTRKRLSSYFIFWKEINKTMEFFDIFRKLMCISSRRMYNVAVTANMIQVLSDILTMGKSMG